MNKQLFAFLVLLTIGTFSSAAQNAPLAPWTCPTGFSGQKLDIYGWVDYVSADVQNNFASACAVTVTFTPYEDEWAMRDTLKLGNPGYDLLIASGTLVETLAADGLTVPLDHSLIPNQVNVAATFMQPSYDLSNTYSLPYVWGAVGVAYKHDVFPDGIHSWAQVWEHSGKVLWLNDERAMLGIALLNLGYDPNSLNAAEITAARDFLGEHGDNLLGIYNVSSTSSYLTAGEADIVIVYTYQLAAYWSECACSDYGLTIPDEGSNIFVDNMLIPTDADSPELAQAFMDYVLHPAVNAAISNAIPSSTNATAAELALIDERYLNEIGFNPSSEILDHSFFIMPLAEDMATFYDVAWGDLLLYYGELN